MRNLGEIGSINTCSDSYEVGEWSGIIVGIGTGWIGGTKSISSGSINWQNFSHSLLSNSVLKRYAKNENVYIRQAAKWMKKVGNRLNGDHVPPGLHTRMDVRAQWGVSKQHLAENPVFLGPRNIINRIPYVPGSITYGISSERFNNE